MKTDLGGYFVTNSALRANNERKLTYFLAKLPAPHQILDSKSTAVHVANALKPWPPCYVDIYIDGAPYDIMANQPSTIPRRAAAACCCCSGPDARHSRSLFDR